MAGINVYVHWTFTLLLAWILMAYLLAGQGLSTALLGVMLICGLFACVVLHELGHALMARRFGIGTADITLFPIGGLARLERIPEDPRQELWIAIAGPLVNVTIAATLAGVLLAMGSQLAAAAAVVVGGSLLAQLMWANVWLAVFNLLPAFPMDGGRVLRALLAYRLPYGKATQIAASVGQGMAILFGIGGAIIGSWILMFIALFVYLAAGEEAAMVQLRTLTRGIPVRDAMARSFRTLRPQQMILDAAKTLHEGYHGDFPVVNERGVVGILLRRDVLEAVRHQELDLSVAEILHAGCPILEENMPLSDAIVKMHQCGCPSVAVLRGSEVVGLLSHESLGEWIAVHTSLGKREQAPKALAPLDSVNQHDRDQEVIADIADLTHRRTDDVYRTWKGV